MKVSLSFSVNTSGIDAIFDKFPVAVTRAERELTKQVAKDTDKYVPKREGSLESRTKIKGNKIIYPGPYSRYLWYGKKMIDPLTGKGPAHWIDKEGKDVFRYRKGAKLIPSSQNLRYTTEVHPLARKMWFLEAKKVNRRKWRKLAVKLVKGNWK